MGLFLRLLWRLAKIFLFLVGFLITGVFRLGGLISRWIGTAISGKTVVHVRRDWNDRRVGRVYWSDLANPRWDTVAGGTKIESRRPLVYAYVWCNRIQGDIAHSCSHGPGPHNIKVCLMKKDNSREVWKRLSRIVGPEKSYRG